MPVPAITPPEESAITRPGEFCARADLGLTSHEADGTQLVCGTYAASPVRARWHQP